MKDARQISGTPVRMPPELKRWMQHQAVDNHRSLNGEIVIRLEESRRQQMARQQQERTA